MIDHYILDGHTPVQTDLMTWARWLEKSNGIVAQTDMGQSKVSTVFLGLNHNYGDGPPSLFETMVFNGPLDQEMDRYSTWDEAVAGHSAMCERVRDGVSEA